MGTPIQPLKCPHKADWTPMKRYLIIFLPLAFAYSYSFGCNTGDAQEGELRLQIERLDPELDSLLAPTAKIEKLASGFKWSEGPVWLQQRDFLLFSDIPNNQIMKWSESEGLKTYAGNERLKEPGPLTRFGPGSNGMAVDSDGNLIICQQKSRRLIQINQDDEAIVLADRYLGKKFNSPNDLVVHSNGDIYFTDPPYGLPQGENDPSRETDWFGVYKVDGTNRSVSLLTKRFTRPNGIGLSPDEKRLYVAQSDADEAIIVVFDIQADGSLTNERTFFDMTPWAGKEKGLPDGMAIDVHGNLWATGPGGVWVITPDGKALGRILTGVATANCAFGSDGSTLFLTSHMFLLRVKTKSLGLGFDQEQVD